MGERLHLWIAAFLAVVDLLIAVAVARAYSWTASMVFLLSPIGLLISGFHSQFDNLAVLMGLLAWLLIRDGKPKTARMIVSSVCLGISLVIKHVLFLFPIWLVFWKPLGKLRCRILYAVMAYGLFAGSFLPWWGDPASRAGIVKNVFQYKSNFGVSWLGYVVELLPPIPSLDTLLRWIPAASIFEAVWIGLMMAAGAALARKGVREMYLFYLMLLFASTPAMVHEYTAIPLLAAAVFYSAWESWAFIAAGTIVDLWSGWRAELLTPDFLYRIPPLVFGGRPHHLLITNWDRFFLVASQFCIGALLVRQWRQTRKPSAPTSLWVGIWRAAALIAVGGLPVVLTVAKAALGHGGTRTP